MGYHPIHIVGSKFVALQYLCHIVTHIGHGIAEHCTTLLIEVVQTMIDGEMGCGADRTASLHVKERQADAIGTQIRILHAHILLFRCFHKHCTGSVAEEHAGGAILIVDERRHLVGTDDDNLLVASALNHRSGHIKRIKESAACCLKVESKGILQTKLAKND